MGHRKRSIDSSDSENWKEIFKGFVKILREKEEKIESLVKGWKILEERIKTQHECWVSDVHNYEYQLSMLKSEAETVKMMRLVEIAKYDLMLGLKRRDLSLCKSKLEDTQDKLDIFKAWFDLMSLSKNKEVSNSGDDESKLLEAKIRKQKLEFEKLAFEKRLKVSNLLQETGFAWNQFKEIESEFTKMLMAKDEEIKEANKKISSLEEQLQSSNHEKNEIISRLKSKVSEFEDKASKKDKKITRSSQEVKSVRRSTRLAKKQN